MVTWLRGPSALEQLGDRFDDLADAAGLPFIARRTWLQAWADTYRDAEPWVACVDGPGGRLDACAVLARRVRGAVVDVVNLGRGPSDDTHLPARSPEAAEALAAGLADGLRSIGRPWRLRVEQLPVDCPVAASVVRRLPVAAVLPGDGSPVVELRPGAPAESYMSKSMRQNVRTALNRLARDGRAAHYVHEISPAGVGAFVPEMERVWRARDRAVGRPSGADDPAALGFFLGAVRRLADAGEVELTVLLIDGAMAAFAVCLLDGPSYRVWVPRIAPDFAAYSPGHLVTRALLARAAERGFAELDWMRGEEPDKRQTATAVRPHQHLMAWSSPLLRTLTEGARLGRARLHERREAQARSARR